MKFRKHRNCRFSVTRRSIYRLRLNWLWFWCSECSLCALCCVLSAVCSLSALLVFYKCFLGALWLLTECSLNAHWILTDCSLTAHWLLLTDLSRDCNGMWDRPLIQLILPYKISCIWGRSHIPLLSHDLSLKDWEFQTCNGRTDTDSDSCRSQKMYPQLLSVLYPK